MKRRAPVVIDATLDTLRRHEQLAALAAALVYLIPVELIEDKVLITEAFLLIIRLLNDEFEVGFMEIITSAGNNNNGEEILQIHDAVFEAFKKGFEMNVITSNMVEKNKLEKVFLNIYYFRLTKELLYWTR